MKRRHATLLIAILLMITGACQEQSSGGVSANVTPGRADSTVGILQFTFDPERVEISPGEIVEWRNSDPFFHTVTSGKTDGPENEPDGKFDRDLKDRGDTVRITFEKPGEYSYYCKQHNAMNGVVQVS